MEKEELILPELQPDDYLTKGADFWKKYRQTLTKIIDKERTMKKPEKTPENILKFLETHGVKHTARYFDIQPSQVRYYRNKYEKKDN